MNVLTEFLTALAGLVLAVLLLRLNFWRAVLFLDQVLDLFPVYTRDERVLVQRVAHDAGPALVQAEAAARLGVGLRNGAPGV